MLWFVGAVTLALFLFTNFPWTLDEYDQAKQAFISFEMAKEGHWIYQHTPEARVATKPPLIGWVTVGLFEITRSWGAAWRLPSVFAAIGISILLFNSARNAYGHVAGLVALSAFSLNLLTPRLASLVRTDMPLALVIFALGLLIWNKVRSAAAWIQRDRVLFFALLTAAMLIKGPIVYAFLLPGIALFQWRVRKRDTKASTWPGWWPWIASLAIFLAWAAGGIFFVPGFYDEVVVREFAGRFTETIHKPEPTYFYVFHLLHKFAPWSVLMILLAIPVFRSSKVSWRDASRQISPELFWLLSWCAGGILIMSIVPSKRVDRIFPVIPPLCLLLAAQVEARNAGQRFVRRAHQWSGIAVVLALLMTGEYAIAKVVKESHYRALAAFGQRVRRESAAKGWHYEIIGRLVTASGVAASEPGPRHRKWTHIETHYKEGILLLYLDRTRFLSVDEGIAAWNSGAVDALVAPMSEWPRLSQELRNVAPTPQFEASANTGVKYIFITRSEKMVARHREAQNYSRRVRG